MFWVSIFTLENKELSVKLLTRRLAGGILDTDMHTILLVGLSILGGAVVPSLMYFLQRQRLRKAERLVSVVRRMEEIDRRIFLIRSDSSRWPCSAEAQVLIVRRVELHEEYCFLLGHPSLRDCAYTSELMNSAISSK